MISNINFLINFKFALYFILLGILNVQLKYGWMNTNNITTILDLQQEVDLLASKSLYIPVVLENIVRTYTIARPVDTL